MGRWRVMTEKKRDAHTGQWSVKFFAVSPNGMRYPYASYAAALLQCGQAEKQRSIPGKHFEVDGP